MIVPAYLPYYVLGGTIGMIAALLFGLRSALRNAGWTTYDRTVTVGAAAITVIGWFLLAIALASVDAYRGTADRIPTIQYGILVPVLVGGLLIWRSPRVARIIDAVPQHWLVGVQLYRTLGVIFLILYATGKLPGLFAWPAGLGDVVVGDVGPELVTGTEHIDAASANSERTLVPVRDVPDHDRCLPVAGSVSVIQVARPGSY